MSVTSQLSPILTIQDIPLICSALHRSGYTFSEYTAANLYSFAQPLDTRMLDHNGHIYFSSKTEGILYPCASEPVAPEELLAVSSHLGAMGRANIIKWVPLAYPEHFPEVRQFFSISPMPDGCADYICPVEQIAQMQGRRFSSQRNKISQFKKKVPDWHQEKITKEKYHLIIECYNKWETEYQERSPLSPRSETWEKAALARVEDAFDALALEGLMIMNGKDVLGFTLYSRLNATMCDLHFKKNLRGYPGLSSLLFQETARLLLPGFSLINLEYDLALPGLREEKTLLHPTAMLEALQLVPKEQAHAASLHINGTTSS